MFFLFLVEVFDRKNGEFLRKLINGHSDRLYAIAYSYLKNHHDAKDVVPDESVGEDAITTDALIYYYVRTQLLEITQKTVVLHDGFVFVIYYCEDYVYYNLRDR